MLFCSCFSAFAITVPSDYFYIKGNCSLGAVTVYVPYNYSRLFGLGTDGNFQIPINENSSTISCKAVVDSTGEEYTFSFNSFGEVSFRSPAGDVQDTVIHITDTNLPTLNTTDFTIFSQDTLVNMGLFLMIGVIVVLCIMRL